MADKQLAIANYTNYHNDDPDTPGANDREIAWKEALDDLNKQLVLYRDIGDPKTHAIEEKEQARIVVEAMYRVSEAHTDVKGKEEYRKKAEKFEKASPKQRNKQMNALLKGLAILLASPFILAGAALFVAGSIIYGVGLMLKGLGQVVTGGVWDDVNLDMPQASTEEAEDLSHTHRD